MGTCEALEYGPRDLVCALNQPARNRLKAPARGCVHAVCALYLFCRRHGGARTSGPHQLVFDPIAAWLRRAGVSGAACMCLECVLTTGDQGARWPVAVTPWC